MASSSGGYAADGASEHTAGTHEDASEHEKKRVAAATDEGASEPCDWQPIPDKASRTRFFNSWLDDFKSNFLTEEQRGKRTRQQTSAFNAY